MDKFTFTSGQKRISVYPAELSSCPVIYIHLFKDNGDALREGLWMRKSFTEKEKRPQDFHLVTVYGLNWNRELSPWALPKGTVPGGDEPFEGGADDLIAALSEEIIPVSEKGLSGISWRGIAGYSLAGLFSLYCLYKTPFFSRAASMSGSLWYPGFLDYALKTEMKSPLSCCYLSLGSKEAKVRNPILKTVQQNTQQYADHLKEKGIRNIFELNPGNHFQQVTERTLKGLAWLLDP